VNLSLIWRCAYRASYCDVLMNKEMHNSYNQFLFHSFLVCSKFLERIYSFIISSTA
jgi:hypothetical protein